MMISQIEDFGVELWLEVFNYLPMHEQFRAFWNLNEHINRILFAYRTKFYLKYDNDNYDCLLKYFLPYLSARETISYLKLEQTKRVDFESIQNSFVFPRLRTFVLHRLNIDKYILNIFQQNSNHLRYIYISLDTSGAKKIFKNLLEIIVSLKYLCKCQLRLAIATSELSKSTVNLQNPMKFLRLLGERENCSTKQIANLLDYLPNLETFHLIVNQLKFSPQNKSNSSITKCILNINQFDATFINLIEFISTIAPHVEDLTIIFRTPFELTTYVDIYQWNQVIPLLLTKLQHLTLEIKHTDHITNEIWDRHCKRLSKFMTKNDIILRLV